MTSEHRLLLKLLMFSARGKKKPEVTRTGNETESKLLREKKKKRIDGTWPLSMETKRKGVSQVALKHQAYDRTCPEIYLVQ